MVDGAIDEVPEIKAARDIFLTYTDLGLFPSENDADTDSTVWEYEPPQNVMCDGGAGIFFRFNPVTGKNDFLENATSGFATSRYSLQFFLVNGAPVYRMDFDSKYAGNNGKKYKVER